MTMTIAEKYAAIVALLKDEHGNWIENVSGADVVQEVSIIIDAPVAPDNTVAVDRGTLMVLAAVARDAADLLDCNCADREGCQFTCTHSMAVAALAALKTGEQK